MWGTGIGPQSSFLEENSVVLKPAVGPLRAVINRHQDTIQGVENIIEIVGVFLAE